MPAASAEAPPSPRKFARGVRRGPGPALARRAFRDARVRTFAFAYLFAAYSYIQPIGYRHAYPTLSDRLGFARSFGDNAAIRLFYGEPHDLLTVGGYCAWRVGGTLAIMTAIYGLLAAVRALRGEEESGRGELVLAGIASRRTVYLSAMAAIAAGTLLLWLAELAGLVLGGLPIGGSAYLALATVSVVPVCVGVGAIASQLAPTRRSALELGGAIVGLFFLLRVIADTSRGLGWLRWTTPLGWAEQLRPFGGAHPFVLLLPVAASALLLVVAARMASARDIGTGVFSPRDSSAPRLRLLSSPTALALRSERGSLLAWSASVAVFALILGVISKSISAAGISKSIQREISKLGSGSILTPRGYIAFVFIFFILAVSLFVCVQISAVRHDEADQRLETLLALPFSRSRFLAGRLLLAAGGAVAISLVAGLLSWAGAASQGVSISLWQLLEAGANCLPVAMMFLGIAALAYALAPRASSALAYGLVAVTFLWYLVGALTGVPRWVADLTPFEHVGLVPVQQFRTGAAAIMLAIGAVAAVTAVLAFKRRDLLGA
jgi:ABC-2 type transport system permease protein